MRRLFALVAGVLVSVSSVFASTLYVPTQYSTIQAAVNAAVSGDSIIIKTGTYAQATTIIGKSNLTIQGEGAGQTIMAKTAATLFYLEDSDHIVFKDFSLKNSSSGFNFWGCHDLTFQNLAFSNVQWSIDSISGGYAMRVAGCVFQGSYYGVHSQWDWFDDGGIDNPVFLIESNQFIDSWVGVHIDSSDSCVVRRNDFLDSGNVAIGLNNWNSHAIYENIIDGGHVGLFITTYDDEFYPPDLGAPLRTAATIDSFFYNNIIYRTTVAGIYGDYELLNETVLWIRNNIFYQNSGSAIFGENESGEGGLTWNEAFKIGFNDFYSNALNFSGSVQTPARSLRNLYVNPKFTDPANGNFTLQSGSFCVDTGTLDIDGDGDDDITNYKGRSRDRGVEER